jgi:hypothetical protein
MIRFLLILAFLAACGAPADEIPEPSMVFAPEPGLLDVATDWAATWSAATGRTISIGEGGIPMRAVDDLSGPCGHSDLRFSKTSGRFLRTAEVLIDMTPPAGCVGWGYTVGHEMAHAFSGVDHTSDPESLMALSPKRGMEHTADASAVTLVCSAIDCVN